MSPMLAFGTKALKAAPAINAERDRKVLYVRVGCLGMAKQAITRRQKDISRLLRERKEAQYDKLKARREKWNGKK